MQQIMKKSTSKIAEPESSSESEIEQFEDDENRLSDDEEFPISEDEVEVDESSKKKGWASSMAKVLNSEKSGVLSKAKKDEDVAKKKEKKSYTFEVDGEEVVDEKPNEKDIKRAFEKQKLRERRENKLRVFSLRLKPSTADIDRERTFKKIATRGVVQLFNAVKTQQNTMETKLQSTKLESKRDEIIRNTDNKKNFLDSLMSGPRARLEIIDKGVKKEKMDYSSGDSDDDDEEVKESSWSALRNDFMTGKKVGWDKDDNSEDEKEMGVQEESSDSD